MRALGPREPVFSEPHLLIRRILRRVDPVDLNERSNTYSQAQKGAGRLTGRSMPVGIT